MDGIITAGFIVGALGGFSIPTYIALLKVYSKQGNYEARLASIEKKLDKLNGFAKTSK